jgi:hypothetical protein
MKSERRWKFSGTFSAKDDAGAVHKIDVFSQYVRQGRRGTVSSETQVPDSYGTADGRDVRRISKGKYQVIETGVILRSEDQAAP